MTSFPEYDHYSTNSVIKQVWLLVQGLDPDARIEVFKHLDHSYCTLCGFDKPDSGECDCLSQY